MSNFITIHKHDNKSVLNKIVEGSPLQDGDVLTYNGGSPEAWTNEPIETGATSTDITSWTLVSGDLYYGDFTHNLNTEDLAVAVTDNDTDKIVQPEDIEFLSANAIRVFVRADGHDLHVVCVTGRGPQGVQGETGADGDLTAVVGDTTPQLGGDLDINKMNFHFVVPTVDHTTSGKIVTATVDSNATGFGAALYMADDGNFDEADADTNSPPTIPCRALAAESGTGSKKVLLEGFIKDNSWSWTAGADLYISTTTGALTQVPPGSGDQVQKVGYAWSSSVAYFNPGDFTMIEVAT